MDDASPVTAARLWKASPFNPWNWRLLMLAAMLPIVVLGVYSYRVAAHSVRNFVSDNNDSAAKITGVLLKRELERSISFAQTIATLPGTDRIVEQRDEEAMRARLKSVVESSAGIDRATLSGIDGILWCDYPQAPEMRGRNISEREWFQGFSETYEPYVSGRSE